MSSIFKEDILEYTIKAIESYIKNGEKIISISIGSSLYINNEHKFIILDKIKTQDIAKLLKEVNSKFPEIGLVRCYPMHENELIYDKIYLMSSENFPENEIFKIGQLSGLQRLYIYHSYAGLPRDCYVKVKHLLGMSKLKLILFTSGLIDTSKVQFGLTDEERVAVEIMAGYGKPFVEEHWTFPYK